MDGVDLSRLRLGWEFVSKTVPVSEENTRPVGEKAANRQASQKFQQPSKLEESSRTVVVVPQTLAPNLFSTSQQTLSGDNMEFGGTPLGNVTSIIS
ncbi:hypothetical protein VM1G_11818 [Cytospora mali]|uniref:Uncharacterized protein n=1 Tax=Cytospora mali TaxID=578113 RepID=A0A194W8L4_CYTMA|nr:hypothetical protein VM1G_11818 [Valsa mali]